MVDEMDIPNLFFEKDGGSMYVVLREEEDSVLLGVFGLVEEGQYVTRNDEGEWVFEARYDDRVENPAFSRIYEESKDSLREKLQGEEYYHADAIREAWDNWSVRRRLKLQVEGDDREMDYGYDRLTEYDRHDTF